MKYLDTNDLINKVNEHIVGGTGRHKALESENWNS